MTIQFPDDKEPKKETFGVGARVDVEAGRRHEVWMGADGCEYVIWGVSGKRSRDSRDLTLWP